MKPSGQTFPHRVVALQVAAQALVDSFYGWHPDNLPDTACRVCNRIPTNGHSTFCLVGPVEDALRGLESATSEPSATPAKSPPTTVRRRVPGAG